MTSQEIGQINLPNTLPKLAIPDVEGFLSENEGNYLYSLAQRFVHLGAIVEIGSYKGRSTVFLAKGCESVGEGKVFAIDPQTPDGTIEKEFRQNIQRARTEKIVVPMVLSSIEAVQNWRGPVAVLWVDGDHKYRGVRADFFAWYPHVAKGGAIAFHDTLNRKAVARFVGRHIRRLERSGAVKVLDQVEEILAVQKIAEFSLIDNWRRTWFVRKAFQRRHFALARAATQTGKDFLRSGDAEKARECFRLALFYYPMHWKNYLRILTTRVPWLCRRYIAKQKRLRRPPQASRNPD